MTDHFRSQRLVYRAFDLKEDVEWQYEMRSDAIGLANSSLDLVKPESRSDVEKKLTMWHENPLMSVVICLPNDNAEEGKEVKKSEKLTPVGSLGVILDGPSHHRAGSIGLNIRNQYQGNGYGTEAIEWALRWGFQIAGLHRVAIGTASYNTGAVRLYDRMGFVREFEKRESIFYNGEWHNYIEWSLLEHEWREKQKAGSA